MQTTTAEEAPSAPVVTAPKKSLKEIVLEAQQELRTEINALRQKILTQLDQLNEIGGTDVYEEAVMAFVNAAGADGIQVSRLHAVLPDSAALTTARLKLVEKNKINAVKSGMSFKLTPIKGTPMEA